MTLLLVEEGRGKEVVVGGWWFPLSTEGAKGGQAYGRGHCTGLYNEDGADVQRPRGRLAGGDFRPLMPVWEK